MSLSGFIRAHHEEIISEFALFAKKQMPPGPEMTEAELRDHAEDILTAVVEDLSIAQSPEEQSLKSRGRGAVKTMEFSGTLHADDRIQHGFTFRAVPRGQDGIHVASVVTPWPHAAGAWQPSEEDEERWAIAREAHSTDTTRRGAQGRS